MSKLSNVERRVMRYHGMPAKDVARAERLTLDEVMEARAQLRSRGAVPVCPAVEQQAQAEDSQLSLDQVDRMMRTNCAPQPANHEIGWTTATDPEGW